MIPFVIFEDSIIIGYDRRVIRIDIENGKIINDIKEITKPIEDLNDSGKKNVNSNSPEVKGDEFNKAPYNIHHIKISPNNELLAITTKGQKYLLLYKITSSFDLEFLSIRNISRTSSAITFSKDSNSLLVCDKSGDCYLFDCYNVTTPGKWILGHLSVVLDVIFTPDQKYIITCDRDEKIRITNYPDTHEIECYCLGHKEFVSSISLLSNPNENTNFLLSISGDQTMKIWNYKNGKELCNIQLELPGIKHSLLQINTSLWHIAIILYSKLNNKDSICIYEIKYIENESKFDSKLISKHNFDKKNITNICYNKNNGKLYLIIIENQSIDLEILQYDSKNDNYSSCNEIELKNSVKNYLKDYQVSEFEDVSLWFKKKFDNVSDYLERKRKRIEEKCNNKKDYSSS